MKSNEIYLTILEQLGGNKFLSMTGSNNLVYGEDKKGNTYIHMNLSKNESKAKLLMITLVGNDLYDMKFFNYDKRYNMKIITEHNEVFGKELQRLFTVVTGLDTHL